MKEITVDWKSWPHDLREAIGKEHIAIGESNQCDHRPTYQGELDDITKSMVSLYNNWLKLREILTPEEMLRCKRYWDATRRDRTWGLSDDLIRTKISFGWVLCPRWAAVLDDVRKLREILV